jgi:hypothetical protein
MKLNAGDAAITTCLLRWIVGSAAGSAAGPAMGGGCRVRRDIVDICAVGLSSTKKRTIGRNKAVLISHLFSYAFFIHTTSGHRINPNHLPGKNTTRTIPVSRLTTRLSRGRLPPLPNRLVRLSQAAPPAMRQRSTT